MPELEKRASHSDKRLSRTDNERDGGKDNTPLKDRQSGKDRDTPAKDRPSKRSGKVRRPRPSFDFVVRSSPAKRELMKSMRKGGHTQEGGDSSNTDQGTDGEEPSKRRKRVLKKRSNAATGGEKGEKKTRSAFNEWFGDQAKRMSFDTKALQIQESKIDLNEELLTMRDGTTGTSRKPSEIRQQPLQAFAPPELRLDAVRLLLEYLCEVALNLQGLFRIDGNVHKRRKICSQLLEPDVNVREASGHECGGILKMYLRDQDEPLVPFSMYDDFTNCKENSKTVEGTSETKRCDRYIISLVEKLPEEKKAVISIHSEKNKMSPNNLARMFSPGVVRKTREEEAKLDITQIQQSLLKETYVTEYMIVRSKRIFGEVEFCAAAEEVSKTDGVGTAGVTVSPLREGPPSSTAEAPGEGGDTSSTGVLEEAGQPGTESGPSPEGEVTKSGYQSPGNGIEGSISPQTPPLEPEESACDVAVGTEHGGSAPGTPVPASPPAPSPSTPLYSRSKTSFGEVKRKDSGNESSASPSAQRSRERTGSRRTMSLDPQMQSKIADNQEEWSVASPSVKESRAEKRMFVKSMSFGKDVRGKTNSRDSRTEGSKEGAKDSPRAQLRNSSKGKQKKSEVGQDSDREDNRERVRSKKPKRLMKFGKDRKAQKEGTTRERLLESDGSTGVPQAEKSLSHQAKESGTVENHVTSSPKRPVSAMVPGREPGKVVPFDFSLGDDSDSGGDSSGEEEAKEAEAEAETALTAADPTSE